MSMNRKKRAAKGFTLIELVIVIAVIAILAALLVPTILGQAERARVSRARSDVAEIAKALSRQRNDTGVTTGGATGCLSLANLVKTSSAATATTTAADCGVLTNCSAQNNAQIGQTCWGGPYMSQVPAQDPWGTNYDLQVAGGVVTVTSFGPDKVSTGTDNIVVTQ